MTSNLCATALGANTGLTASVPSTTTVPSGTNASWTYTAPPGQTIAGGTISLSLYAPGGISYVSTPLNVADSQDELATCAGACAGSVGGVLTETVPIANPGGSHIYAVAECAGTCTAGGGLNGVFAQTTVYSMAIELSDPAAPTASGFAGGLIAAGPVQATQALTFTAAEASGPGIYNATVKIDGTPVYNGTPDTNGGHCVIAGADPSGFPEYLYSQPCPTSTAVSASVDTTQFADGQHDLNVSITDAAGNSATVFDRTITILNHPTPPPVTPPTPKPANPCTTGKPLKPTLSLDVKALGHARLTFTGKFLSPHKCPLGATPKTRPLVIIEVKNGSHWQAVGATARVSPTGKYKATYGGGHGGSVGGRFSFRAVAPSTPKFSKAISRVRRALVR